LIGSVGRSRQVIYINLESLMVWRRRTKLGENEGKRKGKKKPYAFLLIFLLESFIL
jgi:hypothetical protein